MHETNIAIAIMYIYRYHRNTNISAFLYISLQYHYVVLLYTAQEYWTQPQTQNIEFDIHIICDTKLTRLLQNFTIWEYLAYGKTWSVGTGLNYGG